MRLFLILLLWLMPLMARAETVVIFAAASLKSALDEIVATRADDGVDVTVAYSGSSTAARQVDLGAPADIVFLANSDWMGWLADRGALRQGSRVDLLGNRLVIAGAGQAVFSELADLPARLGSDFLAMAFTDAVPAGIYGKAALTSAGVWDAVAGRVAQTDNVRAALALVARGEARFGVVYETDLFVEPRVHAAWRIDPPRHPAIRYPVALTASARPDAAAVFEDLLSPRAASIFTRFGFTVLER